MFLNGWIKPSLALILISCVATLPMTVGQADESSGVSSKSGGDINQQKIGAALPASQLEAPEVIIPQSSKSLSTEQAQPMSVVAQKPSVSTNDEPQVPIPVGESPAAFSEGGGKYTFTFGEGMPVVECTVLAVCDIELQSGEIIQNVFLGDNKRWQSMPGFSGGDGVGETPHIVVKPKRNDIRTTMIVTTNRRTYHLVLVSTASRYMARVSFDYPDTMDKGWKEVSDRQKIEGEKKRLASEKAARKVDNRVDNLDFGYSVEGDAKWKPHRVYSDGIKTYIEIPEAGDSMEIPILMVVGNGGKEQMVRYRFSGNRYKVDQVLERAVMLSGVGDDQARVVIEKK